MNRTEQQNTILKEKLIIKDHYIDNMKKSLYVVIKKMYELKNENESLNNNELVEQLLVAAGSGISNVDVHKQFDMNDIILSEVLYNNIAEDICPCDECTKKRKNPPDVRWSRANL